jgi:hypothetical protein
MEANADLIEVALVSKQEEEAASLERSRFHHELQELEQRVVQVRHVRDREKEVCVNIERPTSARPLWILSFNPSSSFRKRIIPTTVKDIFSYFEDVGEHHKEGKREERVRGEWGGRASCPQAYVWREKII